MFSRSGVYTVMVEQLTLYGREILRILLFLSYVGKYWIMRMGKPNLESTFYHRHLFPIHFPQETSSPPLQVINMAHFITALFINDRRSYNVHPSMPYKNNCQGQLMLRFSMANSANSEARVNPTAQSNKCPSLLSICRPLPTSLLCLASPLVGDGINGPSGRLRVG